MPLRTRSNATTVFTTAALALLGTLGGRAAENETRGETAQWIWADNERADAAEAYLRRTVETTRRVVKAELWAAADFCNVELYANGARVGVVEDYDSPLAADVAQRLQRGKNVLAIHAVGSHGPSAVAVRLVLTHDDGSQQVVVSDTNWRTARTAQRGWPAVEFDAASWPRARSFGAVEFVYHRNLADTQVTSIDNYEQWKQALGADQSVKPPSFFVAEGFQIEMLRAAGKDEGSWVSMAFDPAGRLAIAKEDKGLLRMTLADDGSKIARVETINDTLLECRGLLFADDSLFANANNSKALYRLRDSNGDGSLDDVKLLYASGGSVGHGRNDLALGPDGMIYSIHGDAVDLPPKDFADFTSPFREARRGQTSQEGHLIRIGREGGPGELLAAGLRNPFGIDFNADGEAFTYDADAEFDMGSPWYRPTRVVHLVGGADYGWRGVTGSWPPYYPDHPDNAPPVLDIGKGSPTAVRFGTKSRFPPRYQRALFILDWAYGRILAIHMEPRGASYVCRGEVFVRGTPLNVTDLDFGPDGAMYVVTGGRKTQSALYRIRYVGPPANDDEPTAQQAARREFSAAQRKLRRSLESLQRPLDSCAIDVAWPHLSSPDPWIRYAARSAVEHQPIDRWRERALAETRPTAAVTALMAMARSHDRAAASRVIQRLNELPLSDFSHTQLLTALYACQLCLERVGDDARPIRVDMREKLAAMYPQHSFAADRLLSQLLVQLDAPGVVPKTVRLLMAAERQEQQLHFLFVLRNVRSGWSMADRRAYFEVLRQTSHYLTGQGMAGFLKRIREEALATLSPSERDALAGLLAEEQPEEPGPEPRPIVRKWQLDDLVDVLDEVNGNRDVERGAALFAAASCVRCHRLGSRGTPIGPDLTSARSRFSRRDLLESILVPSKSIPENYQSVRLVTTDGKVFSGRIVTGGDYRSPTLRLVTDSQRPDKTIEISKSQLESHSPSPISWMPEGLLDTLTKDEVLDLLAYLESGGDTAAWIKRYENKESNRN